MEMLFPARELSCFLFVWLWYMEGERLMGMYAPMPTSVSICSTFV